MAVKALLHYALEVPDQTVGEKFYTTFGLVGESSRGDDALHLRPARIARDSVRLYPGPKKRLHHIAFGAPGPELAATRESIRRAGVREIDPPKGVEGGIWVRDPDGHLVNVRDEDAAVPPADPPLRLNSPGHVQRVGERGYPLPDTKVQPRRLGHVLLFTPDMDRQIDFYTRVLGMKLSDRSQKIVAFMRCTPDHHNLALLTSAGPGFHHGSFEVGSVDEIGMGARHMQDAGFQPAWGIGRHVIGSNFFWYMRDPWGSFAEYFHDIDVIPESCAWEARDFPPEDALSSWGPPVPDDFGLNREVEG